MQRSSPSPTLGTGRARAARREGDRLCARDRARQRLAAPDFLRLSLLRLWAISHLGRYLPGLPVRRNDGIRREDMDRLASIPPIETISRSPSPSRSTVRAPSRALAFRLPQTT